MKKSSIVSLTLIVLVILGVLGVLLLKNKEVTSMDGKDTTTISIGDEFSLTAKYKLSTGYTAFPPKYDTDIFQLVSTRETSSSNGMTGGDQTNVVYTFKALKETDGSLVEVGQYRTFDPEESLEIQEKVLISVVL